MNQVFEPLSGYLELFRLSWEHAFDWYRKSGLPVELADWPTQRANVLWPLAVNHFERQTLDMDSVIPRPFRRQTKHFLLRGSDDLWYSVRFKKTGMDGRSNNIPTNNNEKYLQLPVFGRGHLETMQVSTQHNEQHRFTVGYVANPNGLEFDALLLSWEAQDIVDEIPLVAQSNVEPLSLDTDDDRTAIIEVIGTDEDDEQQAGGSRIQQ